MKMRLIQASTTTIRNNGCCYSYHIVSHHHHWIDIILFVTMVLSVFYIVPMDAFHIISTTTTRNCQTYQNHHEPHRQPYYYNDKRKNSIRTRRTTSIDDVLVALRATSNNNDDENVFTQQPQRKIEYSRELQLREEAESPFRKVRFFFYISLGGGAFISLGVSAARVAAAVLAQINIDLLPESIQNVMIDSIGLIVLYTLYQNDLNAQESKLKRAAKGSDLTKLKIRASKQIIQSFQNNNNNNNNDFNENEATTTTAGTTSAGTSTTTTTTFITNLASLRTGRGIDKRVIIVAGGKQKIQQIIQEVITEYNDDMIVNDLLLVPIVLPQCIAPDITTMLNHMNTNTTNIVSSLPPSIALPVTSTSSSDVDAVATWNYLMNDESNDAKGQGIDVLTDGFCIILKKNGRVGQRTKGINLRNMVGEVTAR